MKTEKSQTERKEIYMHRGVVALLGSSYSWAHELYYRGNPMSESWQTETERAAIARLERNWHEATTA